MVMLALCKEGSARRRAARRRPLRDSTLMRRRRISGVSSLQAQSGLELLRDFLMTIAKSNKSLCQYNVPFGYLVRRFVVPTLLSNMSTKLSVIFRALLQILTELWKHFRRHLKIELATILECVLLAMLKSRNASPYQKIDVVSCIASCSTCSQDRLSKYFSTFKMIPP